MQALKSNTRNGIAQLSHQGRIPSTPPHFPSAGAPFLTLSGVTLRVGGRHLLAGTDWMIRTGDQWAVVGPNGSGKTTLVRALAGRVPVVAGRIHRHSPKAEPRAAAYVGFEQNRWIMDREERIAEAEAFAGTAANRMTVRRLLAGSGPGNPGGRIIGRFRLEPLLDRRVASLSNGERQRVWLARAVAAAPGLLILDEPFDGLDRSTRRDMMAIIDGLMARGTQAVVVSHREKDLPAGVTHLLRIADDRVVYAGPRPAPTASGRTAPAAVQTAECEHRSENFKNDVLIRMNNVTVGYGGRNILRGLDWTVRTGEHWSIQGPNGCGKSTLMALITTENLQGYANDIEILGRQRGSGESVWEIRRQIGRVSQEFQLRYRGGLRVSEVVVSGFFDSIGLFRTADLRQKAAAGAWIDRLGITGLAREPFDRLSQGEQRMVLLARAMVTSPRLLILDEPCQGLDAANRRRLIGLVDETVRHAPTTLVYVTHDPEESPGCVTDILAFEPEVDAPHRAVRRKPATAPFARGAFPEPVPTDHRPSDPPPISRPTGPKETP